MNLLSLNIGGGMSSRDKQKWVYNLCREHSIAIVGIQETKLHDLNHFDIKAMWGNYNFKVASSSARGRSGGILTVWDPNVFISSRVISFRNILIVEGSFPGIDSRVFLLNIYAPQALAQKRILWNFISVFMQNNGGEYIIFGDFNCVHFSHERIGVNFNASETDEFNEFISDCNLIDVPLGGRSFTRANKAFTKRSLIDRFLVSNGILNVFPRSQGFDDVVTKSWQDTNQNWSSNPQIRFKEKLKNVKMALKSWHKDYQIGARMQKTVLKNRLKEFDDQIEVGINSSNVVNERASVIKDLAALEELDTMNLAQKKQKIDSRSR
ncbi:uncharacterized protein [Rutidosis leptorrhynchoides]|uniref:uncharacterized protein n=1 Tax=Rutidosis leptorrhynchoides TaxID=125765 RepID=UPI003A99A5B6